MIYRIGTSGYSYRDWLGAFYPTRTRSQEMFGYYCQAFPTVEINYTFYGMPKAKTISRLTAISPAGFDFWIKANQQITHSYDAAVIPDFIASLQPMIDADKLAGILLQFPQSFHRTPKNRRFLDRVTQAFGDVPLAVEFRHYTWQHAATDDSLHQRDIALVVPDVPPIRALYHCPPKATNRIGYLRLHSRNAGNWYDGGVDRYDYNYTDDQLQDLLTQWATLDDQLDQLYVFFNNCHSGQAAQNAQAFQRLLEDA